MNAHDLAKAIGPLLPGGWVLEPRKLHDEVDPYLAVLVRGDGPAIVLRTEGTRTGWRVTFHGRAPVDERRRPYAWTSSDANRPPRITCDAERQPGVLALDIGRRFLPQYLTAYAAAKAWLDNRIVREGQAIALAKALASLAGVEDNKINEDGITRGFVVLHLPTIGTLQVTPLEDGPRVSMRLDCSAGQALAIVRVTHGELADLLIDTKAVPA